MCQPVDYRLLLLFFLLWTTVGFGQNDPPASQPILSAEPNPVLPFYDRLEKRLKNKSHPVAAADTSFDWLAGVWTVFSTGYAKTGFKGQKVFSWWEPPREIFYDENRHFYQTFQDSSLVITTKNGKQRVPFPPQLILQYDKASNLWVFKGGYDWGSEVAVAWTGHQIVFRGTISLAGLKLNERQTWTKVSPDEFYITYEEQLYNGSWFLLERNVYRRQKP